MLLRAQNRRLPNGHYGEWYQINDSHFEALGKETRKNKRAMEMKFQTKKIGFRDFQKRSAWQRNCEGVGHCAAFWMSVNLIQEKVLPARIVLQLMEVLAHAQHMVGVQIFMNWQKSTLPYVKNVYILYNFNFSLPLLLENIYLTIQDFVRHSLFRNLDLSRGFNVVCVCVCVCVHMF